MHGSGADGGERGGRRLGGYREDAPPAALAPAVRALWCYARPAGAPALPGAGHRVVPENGLSLCFDALRRADGGVEDGGLTVMGPIATWRPYAAPAGACLVGVRLSPEACRHVLGVAPEEHVDAIDDGTAVLPALARHLLGPLRATPTPGAALAILVQAVGGRLESARVPSGARLAAAALARLRAGGPDARVAAVARGLGVSQRHLRRVVAATAGVGPKRFHRVERLNRLLAEADARPRADWARLAAAHGFADQAHMVREVGSLTGLSPTRLHRERRAQVPPG